MVGGAVTASTTCTACGGAGLLPFADLGTIPVLCGVHWASRAEAVDSPVGQMRLAYCPSCAYVRNLAFDPDVMSYDTTMDTNLHHSPAFQAFSTELVEGLAGRYRLAGKRVLDIGCGQGEFLRELCHESGCTGVGYDAMYAGPTGPDPSGAAFYQGLAPRGAALPEYDMVTSRHWFEHLADPYEFLVDLRERAGGREVYGYFEVPDARYDLATAGWEVIYPHVSYFDEYSLCQIFTRAGWRIEASGTLFSGMFRYVEVSANRAGAGPGAGRGFGAGPRSGSVQPDPAGRDQHLAAIGGFAARHHAERRRWQETIGRLAAQGARPVLWGAGSRGVQFLTLADPHCRLAAVVDVNPRKWGRYLPVSGHRVDPPADLAELKPHVVISTNPAYRTEIAKDLADLGVDAEILAA